MTTADSMRNSHTVTLILECLSRGNANTLLAKIDDIAVKYH